MTVVLWRECWLKPLSNYDIQTDICKFCNQSFEDRDIVTSCEFCEIGIMHSQCADDHIFKNHTMEVQRKIELHKDRRYTTFNDCLFLVEILIHQYLHIFEEYC